MPEATESAPDETQAEPPRYRLSFLRYFRALLNAKTPEEADFSRQLWRTADEIIRRYVFFGWMFMILLAISLVYFLAIAFSVWEVDSPIAPEFFAWFVDRSPQSAEAGSVIALAAAGAVPIGLLGLRLIVRRGYYRFRADRLKHIASDIYREKSEIYQAGTDAFNAINAAPSDGTPRKEQAEARYREGWHATQQLDAADYIADACFYSLWRRGVYNEAVFVGLSAIVLAAALAFAAWAIEFDLSSTAVLALCAGVYWWTWTYLFRDEAVLESPEVADESGEHSLEGLRDQAAKQVGDLVWYYDTKNTGQVQQPPQGYRANPPED